MSGRPRNHSGSGCSPRAGGRNRTRSTCTGSNIARVWCCSTPGKTEHRWPSRTTSRADDLHTAVISHLHQDHIGGLPELSNANIVISDAEWQTLNKPRPQARRLLGSHIDRPGLRWQRIDPQALADPTLAPFTNGHDLFGDGSMVLFPTPDTPRGHSRCWSGDPAGCRCCWSKTSPTTWTHAPTGSAARPT